MEIPYPNHHPELRRAEPMISRNHRVWLLTAILAGAAIRACATNIVSDPSFESGTANSYTGSMGDGWVVTAGTGAICNNSGAGCGSAGVAHSGSQMAFLDWSDTFDTTAQTLTTVIGQTYAISYFVAGSQANLLEVTFGGTTLFDGTAPTGGVSTPSDYVEYDFVAAATSTSTVLAFSGERTVSGEILLDDVSVSAVPEPTPWLLTAVPLLGLGALRFKLRRG
jgi:hypothetical protein